ARHVEVQIVADESGGVSHLWDRDCSLQRRHQKLVEIAPSPALDVGLRDRMLEAACRLAGATRVVGLCTFEFLVDRRGDFFFIEANPRLQVEHTVTEAVTGIDLVETQLQLADGKRLVDLGLDSPPVPRGRALELRVQAETLDAEGDAIPSSGRVERFEPPGGPGVRVDTAMRPGLVLDAGFDSLLAKVIVTSGSGELPRLLARSRRALAELRIEGPRTNIALLRVLLDRPELAEGRVATDFITEHAPALTAAAAELESSIRAAHPEETPPGPPDRAGLRTDASKRAPTAPDGTETLRAPLTGTVLEIEATTGERVDAGGTVCILESMKMEHVVAAPSAGSIARILVSVGDVLDADDPIAWLEPAAGPATATAGSEPIDLDRIRPDLAAVRERHAWLSDRNRPEAVARRRARGQRTARENLADLCDPESFIEYGALAIAAQRRSRPLEELRRKTPADGILTGFGTVNADLFGPEASRCAMLVADATVLAGT
ncbi:MAG TPA: biotin/lipoyl-containing protein, partial [Myxococcota bacterium]|nr:biotin/lipoyl-containing protein [Myxococcota bacterium]